MIQHKVSISSTTKVPDLAHLCVRIRACVEQTLTVERLPLSAHVDVTLTNDEEIRGLNAEYRSIDRPTDVLSFPLCNFQNGVPEEDLKAQVDLDTNLLPLGDIVLSYEHAIRQAREYGHSAERECCYLMVHSVLHLLGYDHERGEGDRDLMRKKEEEILALQGLARQEGEREE